MENQKIKSVEELFWSVRSDFSDSLALLNHLPKEKLELNNPKILKEWALRHETEDCLRWVFENKIGIFTQNDWMDAVLSAKKKPVFDFLWEIVSAQATKEESLRVLFSLMTQQEAWGSSLKRVLEDKNLDLNEVVPSNLALGFASQSRNADEYFFRNATIGKDAVFPAFFARSQKILEMMVAYGLDLEGIVGSSDPMPLYDWLRNIQVEAFDSMGERNAVMGWLKKSVSDEIDEKKAWRILISAKHEKDIEDMCQKVGNKVLEWKGPEGETILHRLALWWPKALPKVIKRKAIGEQSLEVKDKNGFSVRDYMKAAAEKDFRVKNAMAAMFPEDYKEDRGRPIVKTTDAIMERIILNGYFSDMKQLEVLKIPRKFIKETLRSTEVRENSYTTKDLLTRLPEVYDGHFCALTPKIRALAPLAFISYVESTLGDTHYLNATQAARYTKIASDFLDRDISGEVRKRMALIKKLAPLVLMHEDTNVEAVFEEMKAMGGINYYKKNVLGKNTPPHFLNTLNMLDERDKLMQAASGMVSDKKTTSRRVL